MKTDLNLFQDLKTVIIDSLPKFLGAITYILLCWILIKLTLFIFKRLLKFSRIDVLNKKINENDFFKSTNITINLPVIATVFIKWFLVLLLIILGADIFGLEKISVEVGKLIGYLPTLFTALLILITGIYLASYFKGVIQSMLKSFDISGSNSISAIVFYVILVVTTIITLNHLGINTDILTDNLTIILGAFLAAFTISLGLGSRDVIQRLLFGFYSRKTFEIGQRIKINDQTGTIISIDNISLVLENDNKKTVYPIKTIVNQKIEILE